MNGLSRILILFVGSVCLAKSVAIAKFSSKYPYNLLTPAFNVVTEDDLAYDNYRREIGPYDPKASLSQLYWQCFPVDDVGAGFDAWVGPDGMGPTNAIYTMCSLKISARANHELQLFTDRRAHQIGFCLDFTNEWKRLTK